jgi:hypothetical protein
LTYTFVAHYNGSSVQKYRLLVRDTDGTLQTTTTSPVVNLTVTPLTQPTFYIASTYGIAGAGIVLYTAGGAGTGAVTYTYVATGSAAGCSLVGTTLTLLTSGVCKVIATKAGDLDYVLKVSDTATVSFVSFQVAAQIAPTNTSTGISTSGSTTTTKGSNSCSSNCVPRIDSLSSYTGHIGDSITLTGENFSGATKVIFNVFTNAATYSVVSDTSLTVTIPASLPTGETGIEVVTPNGTSPRNYDFEIVP